MVIFVTDHFSQKMKHTIDTTWLANPWYQGCIHFPHNVGDLIRIFRSSSKWRFPCSIKWSHKSPAPLILSIEPGIVIIFWAHRPNLFPTSFLLVSAVLGARHQPTTTQNIGAVIRRRKWPDKGIPILILEKEQSILLDQNSNNGMIVGSLSPFIDILMLFSFRRHL